MLTTKDLILNIAVNLGRIGRFALEKKTNRLNQFLAETQQFIQDLEPMKKSSQLQRTIDLFKKDFDVLKNNTHFDIEWSEKMFTWANILTHRSIL